MELSVIIVSWNTRDLLQDCLQSIDATAAAIEHEIVVIDNASTDGTLRMLREQFPHVVVVANEENAGFAPAVNQGIRQALGRNVLLLNSDAVLTPGALQALLDCMRIHPDAGIVGGRLINPDGSFQASYMEFPTLWSEFLLLTKLHLLFKHSAYPSRSEAQSRKPSTADWLPGTCMLVRKALLDQIGSLDETFFMYAEEVDFCWRAHHAGWNVYYTPHAKILHWDGASISKVNVVKRKRVYYGKLLFFQKHHGRFSTFCYRWLLAVSTMGKIMLQAPALFIPRSDVRKNVRTNLHSYFLLLRVVFFHS